MLKLNVFWLRFCNHSNFSFLKFLLEAINLDKRLWIMQLKEMDNLAIPTDNIPVSIHPQPLLSSLYCELTFLCREFCSVEKGGLNFLLNNYMQYIMIHYDTISLIEGFVLFFRLIHQVTINPLSHSKDLNLYLNWQAE